MRTPNIEALHRAINWLNQHFYSNLELLGLDCSPIDSNGWLAGFLDDDANFSINLTDRKKMAKYLLQAFFRIELRQNYHRSASAEQGGNSSFGILSLIARYFNVNLYSRSREQKDKIFFSYMVVSYIIQSNSKVIEYFTRFPLYSSKYLAYRDWKFVVEQIKLRYGKPLTSENIQEITRIKAQFNNNRKKFDFSHLNSII